jgi:hypothetical protein
LQGEVARFYFPLLGAMLPSSRSPAIIVLCFRSCQRDVPKPGHFNGSIGATGGQAFQKSM